MTHGQPASAMRRCLVGIAAIVLALGACSRDGPLSSSDVAARGDVGQQAVAPAMAAGPRLMKLTVDNHDGTFTYTQDVTTGYAFQACRYYSQDSGWQHTFPDFDLPGRTIMSVTLTIRAWDVDAEPYHGWEGEYDGIKVDDVMLNPGYLQGSNGILSTTTFDVPVSRLTDDGVANVWVDIDMHHTRNTWCTMMDRSTLTVVYRDGPVNHPPYQPVLQLAPDDAPPTDADLTVLVVGPIPGDPDGHAVTYSYRWFLNTGTGGFLDPQVHGRGVITGNTVPESATEVNDEWRVEVTPRDELGAVGDYAVATFPKVTPVLNHPPVPQIQLIRDGACPDPYLEGGRACIAGIGTYDPDDDDISALTFHWEFGDGTTLDVTGVAAIPPHVYVDNGTYTVTLTVTDSRGASASTSATVVVANVAPVVDATPNARVNWGAPYTVTAQYADPGLQDGPWTWSIDWGNGDMLQGSSANPATPIQAQKAYFAIGTYTVTTCVTDKDGARGCDQTIVEVVDPTPPVITFTRSGTMGTNGWYTSGVTLTWSVTDPESPFIASGCEAVTRDVDGQHAFACRATSAGGTSEATATFSIDRTAPSVTYAGNAGLYDIAAQVTITCRAADVMSGLASHTCADVTGPAWQFGLGVSSFGATALDLAGNQGFGQTSFTVKASTGGLCALVELWVAHKGTANSLCVKLTAAANAEARGNTSARNGSLGAFINEVEAQRGKKVPGDKASLLIRFAQALMS